MIQSNTLLKQSADQIMPYQLIKPGYATESFCTLGRPVSIMPQ